MMRLSEYKIRYFHKAKNFRNDFQNLKEYFQEHYLLQNSIK